MPIAAILSSAGEPSAAGDRSGLWTPTLADDVKLAEGRDDPGFERRDEGSDVLPPPLEIEQHIGNPLPRTVIGIFAAAAGLENGEARRLDEIFGPRAGAGRIERRMFQEIDRFRRFTPVDRRDLRLHHRQGVRIRRQSLENGPCDRWRTGLGE